METAKSHEDVSVRNGWRSCEVITEAVLVGQGAKGVLPCKTRVKLTLCGPLDKLRRGNLRLARESL